MQRPSIVPGRRGEAEGNITITSVKGLRRYDHTMLKYYCMLKRYVSIIISIWPFHKIDGLSGAVSIMAVVQIPQCQERTKRMRKVHGGDLKFQFSPA